MNKYLTLLALLAVCGSVFAETAADCSAFTTSATCVADTSCAFSTTSTTCTNKCNALAKADCTNSTNSPNCDSTDPICGQADCAQYNTNKAGCTAASTACNTYIDPVPYSCASKGTVLSDACAAKNANQGTCEADVTKCTFASGTFSSCSYKPSQCAGKAEGSCNLDYCDNAFVCQTKYEQTSGSPCSGLNQSDCTTQQTAGTGCSWDSSAGNGVGVCDDLCESFETTATCTPSSKCVVKTPYACTDDATTGGNYCGGETSAAGCANSGFCTTAYNTATCTAKTTYCSTKDATACAADTTNCSATTAVVASCPNKATTLTCSGLTDTTTCGANAGCKWNAYSCQNKTAKKCATTDAQTACSDASKFCTYTETGTCSAASSSYSPIVAFCSLLIAFIALL